VTSVTPLPARRRTHPPRARVAEALDAERARVRAWLHDTLLQQLEYIAAGGYADDVDARELMRVAAGAATELRAYVEGTPAGESTLVERLRRIIEDEQARVPYEIRLVFGEVDGTVDGDDLADAAREALTNVRKHARASQVVISCHVTAGTGTVVVADDGIGFDPASTARGTGLRESIVGRMERAGGSAEIESAVGAGTRVTLKVHTPLHAMEAA
jgi:signal transduction histidine kinase